MTVAALLLAIAVSMIGSGRRRSARKRPRQRRLAVTSRRADPLATASALDVLAVCLSAGLPVPAAVSATAPIAPAELGSVLRRAADLLALGADPEAAWQPLVEDDECAAALARLARRSASSGTALAAGVAELAEQSRQDAAHAAAASAERAGVLIAGPLGLCFLPAFVCLGVVPVVAGLVGEIFGAGLW